MKFIGRIADGSTETSARVILLKNLEREITAENLVLIKNGGDEKHVKELMENWSSPMWDWECKLCIWTCMCE
ncbi:MAG: hypothetical protein QXP60_03655 [Nitrososphaerota archaeon]